MLATIDIMVNHTIDSCHIGIQTKILQPLASLSFTWGHGGSFVYAPQYNFKPILQSTICPKIINPQYTGRNWLKTTIFAEKQNLQDFCQQKIKCTRIFYLNLQSADRLVPSKP